MGVDHFSITENLWKSDPGVIILYRIVTRGSLYPRVNILYDIGTHTTLLNIRQHGHGRTSSRLGELPPYLPPPTSFDSRCKKQLVLNANPYPPGRSNCYPRRDRAKQVIIYNVPDG